MSKTVLTRQLRQLLATLEKEQAANDEQPVIDREAIRERARADAAQMRRARNQNR